MTEALTAAAAAARPGTDRVARVRVADMDELGIDALLLSHGADLPWLTGYRAMPLERLTMLVLPRAATPPGGPGAGGTPGGRGRRPVRRRALGRRGGSGRTGRRPGDRRMPAGGTRLAVSDRAWATSLLALQRRMPGPAGSRRRAVTSPIRAVKDASEVEALRRAGAAADRVAAAAPGG